MFGEPEFQEKLVVPSEIAAKARLVTENLLPAKSRVQYEKEYEAFTKWRDDKKAKGVNDEIVLAYFSEKADRLKSSSLWAHYSMLKATLSAKEDVDISKFSKLIAFLKRQSTGYEPKKSKILSRDEVQKFIDQAPDDIFLLMKVVLIVGMAGACRRDELAKMTVKDVDDRGTMVVITIPDTKTHRRRVFAISGDDGSNCLSLFRKYMQLRSKHNNISRLFLNYRNGKCNAQPVGVHTIASIPQKIAKFLHLPDVELYTGHCYRRTSASLLVDGGGDVLALKRHGGWRSSTVAEGYVEDSLTTKVDASKKILGGDKQTASTYTTTATCCFPATSTTSTFTTGDIQMNQALQMCSLSYDSIPSVHFHNVSGGTFYFCGHPKK